MRKIHLLIAFILPLALGAQNIPNGNFESWNTTNYDEMNNGWNNANRESIPKLGLLAVTKTTDKHGGNYAIRLETVSKVGDTVPGYVVNTPGDPVKQPGGFAYSAQPTKITGYYKYSPSGSDKGLILVVFKKNSKIISLDTFSLSAASSYTAFSFNLSLTSAPDTMVFAAVSSIGALNNGNGISGSVLFLDDIAFTGSTTMPAIPNGDFESWTATSIDVLNGWNIEGDNNNVTKTSIKYKGNYAVEMKTGLNGDGSANPAYITNGKGHNGPPDGGQPFTNTIDTIEFYYKYTSVGNDTAMAMLQVTGASNFWGQTLSLPAQSVYHLMEIPINTGSWTPDSLNISFQSSKWPYSPKNAGSSLLIDEVQLKSAPLTTGINGQKNPFSTLRLYPNPANASTRIFPGNDISRNSELNVYNSVGQLMTTIKLNETSYPNGVEIKLDGWKSGMYFYHLSGENSNNEGSFIKE